MPNRLVQEDSGPSRTEYNFHLSCGSLARVELNDGLARGFVSEELGRLFRLEVLNAHSPTAPGIPARGILSIFRDAEHAHACQRL